METNNIPDAAVEAKRSVWSGPSDVINMGHLTPTTAGLCKHGLAYIEHVLVWLHGQNYVDTPPSANSWMRSTSWRRAAERLTLQSSEPPNRTAVSWGVTPTDHTVQLPGVLTVCLEVSGLDLTLLVRSLF